MLLQGTERCILLRHLKTIKEIKNNLITVCTDEFDYVNILERNLQVVILWMKKNSNYISIKENIVFLVVKYVKKLKKIKFKDK